MEISCVADISNNIPPCVYVIFYNVCHCISYIRCFTSFRCVHLRMWPAQIMSPHIATVQGLNSPCMLCVCGDTYDLVSIADDWKEMSIHPRACVNQRDTTRCIPVTNQRLEGRQRSETWQYFNTILLKRHGSILDSSVFWSVDAAHFFWCTD